MDQSALLLLAYPLVGAVAGVLAGMFGIGGGLVLVPVLILIFSLSAFPEGVLVHFAVGTSLATIIVTAISSMYAHHRRGAVEWAAMHSLTPGLVVGALAGAAIADQLDHIWLRRVFGLFEILVALQMLRTARVAAGQHRPAALEMPLVGGLIGVISGVVGIGGGTMTVPYLHWLGREMRFAVATSAACGLPIALAGTLGFVLFGPESALEGASGYVYWPAAGAIGLVSVLFAPLGARLAHGLPVATLKRLFALLLIIVGIRLLL